jgi:hypothetical protein
MPHQMHQDVEDLRFDVRDHPHSIELAPTAIDLAVTKGECHEPASATIRTFSGKPAAFLQDITRPAAALLPP